MKKLKGKTYYGALLQQELLMREREHHDFDVQCILAELYYALSELEWWRFIAGFKLWNQIIDIELFHMEHCQCGFEADNESLSHEIRK